TASARARCCSRVRSCAVLTVTAAPTATVSATMTSCRTSSCRARLLRRTPDMMLASGGGGNGLRRAQRLGLGGLGHGLAGEHGPRALCVELAFRARDDDARHGVAHQVRQRAALRHELV